MRPHPSPLLTPLPPFRRSELDDVGLSRRDLTRLLADGHVVQPLRGVYVDARTADDDAVRARALALALPDGAVATRGLAAWLHGFDPRAPHERYQPLRLECLVDPGADGRRPDLRGVVTHLDRLPHGDVTELGGVPVTTADRTALDVARFLAPHMGLAVVDAMAHAGLIVPAELLQRFGEWPPRQRWMARGKRCLTLSEPDTESYGESWTRLRIVDAGFPRPRPQIWVPEKRQGAFRLDMGWEDVHKAVEFDGEDDHSEEDDQDHDQARRERLRRDHGWTVWAVRKGDVLGLQLGIELAVGELLSLEPQIRQRRW